MIDNNKKEYIESLVNIIRETFNIQTPITEEKLTEIINELGGSLEYRSDMIYDAKIERMGSEFIVSVNGSKPKNRQKFSIAHELGHLFLHMKRLNEEYWINNIIEDSAYYRYGRGIEELESDEFAGVLLMPRDEFLDKYYEYSNLEDVARYFDVSSSAVYVRCKNLGI